MHAQSILAAPVAIELPIGSVFPPVRQQLRLVPCGMDCLLNEYRNFIYVIPRHSRHAGGFLFKTSDNTLIKKKKHFGNIPHYRAYQIIREHRPEGVAAPLRECCCSYEMQFMDGSHVLQSLQVSRRPCIGSPSGLGRTEALLFLRNARAILLGSHRLGIVHGDPGPRNFLRGESGVSLIDLDDVHYTGRLATGWELRMFLLGTTITILKRYGFAKDIAGLWTLRNFAAFGLGAVAHLFWRARRLRSVCRDRSAEYSFDQNSGTQDWPSIRTRRGDGFGKAAN